MTDAILRRPRVRTPSFFDIPGPDFAVEGRHWPNRQASRFVEAAGVNWHYQEMGQGPALLLLHGTAGATHSFRDLMPRLAADFRVIVPDLPGHGFTESVTDERASLPGMARSLAFFLKAVDAKPVIVVGHSAGAAILIRAALDGTVQPRAIIGFAAALKPFAGFAGELFPFMAKLLVLNPVVPRLFAWGADRTTIRRLIAASGSTIDAAGLDGYRQLIGHPGHCAAALAMMARWDLSPLIADLPRLKTRLDLVVGGADGFVPSTDATDIRKLRPATTVHHWAGLGHLAHEEAPDRAAELIRSIAAATAATPKDPAASPAEAGA